MREKNYMRVVNRDETLEISDPLTGDAPNLTREERQYPVKVELIRPIEVASVMRDFVIVQPTKLKRIRKWDRWKGDVNVKLLKFVSESVNLSPKVVGKMSVRDYEKLVAIVFEFNRVHLENFNMI